VSGTNFFVVTQSTRVDPPPVPGGKRDWTHTARPRPLETRQSEIEDAFKRIVSRQDVAILLINQHVANMIRHLVTEHTEGTNQPTLLEVPSKEHPYDPAKDPVMRSVMHMLGLE
jgi:ATP synthase F subunit